MRSVMTWCAVASLVAGVLNTALPAAGAARHSYGSTRVAGCGAVPDERGSPDFNHDHHSDFVIGIPGADDGTGAVEVVEHGQTPVIYRPGSDGIPAMPHGSHFGASTLIFNANGDGCSDLLVTAPGLSVDSKPGAGGFVTLIGSPTGLIARSLVTQGQPNVPGRPEVNGHFGAAVFVKGYQDRESGEPSSTPVGDDLKIGIPGATVMGLNGTPQHQAGEVADMLLAPSGAAAAGGPEDMYSMDYPTAGAHFGTAVGLDYATAPGASFNGKRHIGYIRIDNSDFWGDRTGARLGQAVALTGATGGADKLYGLLVGAPGETVRGHPNAGAVERFDVEYEGPAVYYDSTTTQASPHVPGKPQTGAEFGDAISVGYLRSGQREDAEEAISAPGATVDGVRRAGRIDINSRKFEDSPDGFVGKSWTTETQVTATLRTQPHVGAEFGLSLDEFHVAHSLSASLRLVVGIPGSPVGARSGAGKAELSPIGLNGLTKRWVHVLTRPDGPRAGDGFGASIDGLGPDQDLAF